MQFTSQLEQGDWYVVAGWLCLVSALSLYGIGLLLHKLWRALPAPRRATPSARSAANPRRAEPRTAGAHPARAEAARQPAVLRQWRLVTEIVETRLASVEAVAAWHAAAAIQTDAAEYALARLAKECAAVMRSPAAPVAPRPVPSARPEAAPLAA